MLKNYLYIALRNIKKYKGYAFINILGLAIGMACSILILLWVQDELTFDRFHVKGENLYRIEQNQYYSGSAYHVNVTPYPMGPGVKAEIPEVADACRIVGSSGLLFRQGEKMFFEDRALFVDPSFFEMFTFPLIRGDAALAFREPNSVVISNAIAQKYFGDADPIDKVFQVNNRYSLKVTGILAEMPRNSTLRFEILIPYEVLRASGRTNEDNWGSNNILTFVQLHEKSLVAEVNEKISELRFRRVRASILDNPERLQRFESTKRTEFVLMPLTRIHLHGYFGYGRPAGNIQYVYIFSAIALFVLFIACVNFMNLSTARSAGRAQEIGLRKVVGASKSSIVKQFFGESILLAVLAQICSLCMVAVLLPAFNSISGKQMTIWVFADWWTLFGVVMIALLTGLISGSYPALFLSSFQPAQVLKGKLKSGARSSSLRKVLVVVQFALSIFLLIGTGMVYRQLQFMREQKLGYDKEHVLYIPMRGDIRASYAALKQELSKNSKIQGVTAGRHLPTMIDSNSSGVDWEGKDPQQQVLIGQSMVNYDYLETLKIELLEGRSFSREFATDTSEAFLINEEVMKVMGVPSAVGKRFSFAGRNGRIIGVMKNFHFKSLRDVIEPLAFILAPRACVYMLIRVDASDISGTLASIEHTWKQVIPHYPFDGRFLDEEFDEMYRTEERITSLLKYFAAFAIFIACLGLFGLASFMAEQRTREVGIRKVLGASMPDIVILLSREFTKWVIIANLIAWPAAYLILDQWLKSFAYRAGMNWLIFVLSAVLALVIAMVTVGYQAVTAGLAHPARSLKYE